MTLTETDGLGRPLGAFHSRVTLPGAHLWPRASRKVSSFHATSTVGFASIKCVSLTQAEITSFLRRGALIYVYRGGTLRNRRNLLRPGAGPGTRYRIVG